MLGCEALSVKCGDVWAVLQNSLPTHLSFRSTGSEDLLSTANRFMLMLSYDRKVILVIFKLYEVFWGIFFYFVTSHLVLHQNVNTLRFCSVLLNGNRVSIE